MEHIKPHLNYANVVATLALILAVGGGATAVAITAGKNSVTTKSIRNGAVRAKKLGPIAVRRASSQGIQATARCGKGERILGGGGFVNGGGAGSIAVIKASGPDGRGWTVTGALTNGGTISTDAYALCLRK